MKDANDIIEEKFKIFQHVTLKESKRDE